MAGACGAATGAREACGAGAGDGGEGDATAGEESTASPCFFSIVGGRSVVECLPVVHGVMERNSSNVRTRGLQHFQPVELLY